MLRLNRHHNKLKNSHHFTAADRYKMQAQKAKSSAEMIKLQIEYWDTERSIKLKAIADRERVDLLYARKQFDLKRSQLMRGSIDEYDQDSAELDDASSDMIDTTPRATPPVNTVEDSATIRSSISARNGSCVPTSQQVCARQVMSADLPVFTGDPEDWPVFYSQYNNSTQACGYSNAENLVRLQRCLKGKALEYVRSSLMLPELVPKVIKTLEMLYGRPTVLINSLINKIRTIAPPNIEHLETVIEYGMEIRNLYDHLIAMNQREHLRNPTLLQELEAKLPGEMKMEWARCKRDHAPASLKTLKEFMNERVEAACELTSVGVKSDMVYDDLVFENETRGDTRSKCCLVCKRQNHQVCSVPVVCNQSSMELSWRTETVQGLSWSPQHQGLPRRIRVWCEQMSVASSSFVTPEQSTTGSPVRYARRDS